MAASMDGIDMEKVRAKAGLLGGYSTGLAVSAMVYLGDALGIYAAMRGAGPLSSEDLATRSGLQERWLREWLRQQAAAGILDYDDGRFTLSPETALVLVDEANPFSMIGSFDGLPERTAVLPRIAEAFHTGLGIGFDGRGPNAVRTVERQLGPTHRTMLVQAFLPALDGVVAKLGAGGDVADVGCGSGVALIEMAKAFPRSCFHGYDISTLALARGAENAAAAGVTNVTFHDAATDPLPAAPTFDLVVTFDCLHDMTNPAAAAAAIRRAVREDGTWLIADINAASTFEENMRLRFAPAAYAWSVMGCMSSGLSEPGGAGLGTLGLPEPLMKALVSEAGFGSFHRLPIEHPLNAYYEARL
ncbi:MAG: class I SAM-dependent methyltransferase [Dehalococcoidia bacterium]